ncbi:hypothetical protein DFQ30_004601 [Apophysomyces sp. BC1015]|nr:hypothetical protein DFQ30_004601 [Apophysomyces sp. BC1015]KAG0178225.1 hypothetical protein DFQ29_003776 [Apophysomyces sp. BC1021]
MSVLQTIRDQSLANSLAFWRLLLIAPIALTPLSCKIEDGSFRVRKRGLFGILKQADMDEDGTRTIEAEWMSASVVETRYSEDVGESDSSRRKKRRKEKVILYFHGGAFCTMSAQTHRSLTYKLIVNYRLAPEVRFPGALYDAVQSFLHLLDPERLNFGPENILVMGDSAGAGLCLAMMLYLRDHGLPQPEGAVLLSPWVDLTFSYPSWNDASLYDYLPSNPKELRFMNPASLYLHPDHLPSLLRHPYVSPIFADNFEHLPPILIQSGGCESLRDEIKALTSKMSASKTTLVYHEVYEDMVHVFQAFPFSRSCEAIESIGWWIKAGMPLISESWKRLNRHGSFSQYQVESKVIPLLYGRRYRSIPG